MCFPGKKSHKILNLFKNKLVKFKIFPLFENSFLTYGQSGKMQEVCNIIKACRFFRMIVSFPNLSKNLSALISTIATIGNVFYNLIFLMLFFSILGLNLFKGLLENRCRMMPDPPKSIKEPWPADPNNLKLCGYLSCPVGLEKFLKNYINDEN